MEKHIPVSLLQIYPKLPPSPKATYYFGIKLSLEAFGVLPGTLADTP